MTAERQERILGVLDKRQDSLTIVLENVFDPHNISAVMRTCDAVGVQELYVLNTRIPPHKKWGAKSSSSAAEWLTIHQYTDAEQCFSDLRKKYHRILTTHLSSDASSLHDIDFTDRIALVFGNEHAGVSDEIRSLSDGNFIIPQVGIIKSLNISVACAVTLYEAFRQKSAAGHYDRRSLPEDQATGLLKKWGRGQLDPADHPSPGSSASNPHVSGSPISDPPVPGPSASGSQPDRPASASSTTPPVPGLPLNGSK